MCKCSSNVFLSFDIDKDRKKNATSNRNKLNTFPLSDLVPFEYEYTGHGML